MAASSDGDNPDQGGGTGKTWDGYSDYQTVSSRIGKLIFDAMEAYARVHSTHVEGAPIQPTATADARWRILAAAMALRSEMEHERQVNDDIGTILDRWENGRGGADLDVSVPNDGFIEAFKSIRLYDDDPDWLRQFVEDFWSAGWELGYLKAGEHKDGKPADPVAVDVESMFS